MNAKKWLVMFVALPLLAGIGWLWAHARIPRTVIVRPDNLSVIYDTNYEETLKKGAVPLFEEAFRPYVDVLAEPVAIVDEQDGATTWEVFFATNRDVESSSSSGVRFGNGQLAVPLFGRAEVTIPRRRRGESPEVARAALEKGDRGRSRLNEVKILSAADAMYGLVRQVEESRQKDLLLFVHGFNVDFDSSLVRTAQIALDMPFNGAVVAYSWPSQGGIGNYEVDEPINAASVEPFARFLTEMLDALPERTRINIVVHSMGNRIVMKALGRMPRPSNGKRIANVVLCAPDVGIADFGMWAPGVVDQAKRTTLYSSQGDGALIVSKSLHLEQRAGDAHPPVVCAGIDTIDCSTIDFDFLGHNYYGSNVDVLADLFRVVKEDRDPATCHYLTSATRNGLPYWYFSDWSPKLGWVWHLENRRR